MTEFENKELKIIEEFQNIYSPSTILGVFANAIKTNADGKIILARGEYQEADNSKQYSGYYYENIKSQNDNKFIKAKIPALLRSKLENNNIYIFKGYIEKKISHSTIELLFVVDEILQKEDRQINDEDVKRFEIIQQRIEKGFKDFESLVKEHIYNKKTIRIANIYGSTAIVDKDFNAGLGEASINFEIKPFRCNLSSATEIINQFKKLNTSEFDAIAIIRGGGDKPHMEIYNDTEIGEEIIKLKPLFITALGHVINDTLLDKLADKKFHLPHDYGNGLKVWVDEAKEELAKSKSFFIDQVKKDLTKTFEDQIKTKDETIKNLQKSYEENSKQMVNMATAEFKTKLDVSLLENKRLQDQIKEEYKSRPNVLVYIIISAIIGIIIGVIIANS